MADKQPRATVAANGRKRKEPEVKLEMKEDAHPNKPLKSAILPAERAITLNDCLRKYKIDIDVDSDGNATKDVFWNEKMERNRCSICWEDRKPYELEKLLPTTHQCDRRHVTLKAHITSKMDELMSQCVGTYGTKHWILECVKVHIGDRMDDYVRRQNKHQE